MATNGSNEKWMVRAVVLAILIAFVGLGPFMYSTLRAEDKENRDDIKAVKTYIEEKTETKESHNKDIAHINEKFEFISQQLVQIRKAVER